MTFQNLKMKAVLGLQAVAGLAISGCVLPNNTTTTALPLGDPTAVAACNVSCNTQLLDLSKDFNVLVFGDFQAPSSDVQGRIAAGHDISVSNYSVGDSLPKDANRFDMIAGHDIHFDSGSVANGGIAYGNEYYHGAASVFGNIVKTSPFSFTAAKVQLTGISDSIAAIPSNQTPVITYTGSRAFVTLNANKVQNIYSISDADLGATHTLTINASVGSSVVINVTGNGNASMQNFGVFFAGGITRDHVLFNFNKQTYLEMGYISIEGTVLAPRASVFFPSGQLNGQLVANSFYGAGQLNYAPFAGCLPVASSLNFFKDSFTDSTDGYRVGGTVYEMYGMAVKQVGDYVIVGLNTNFPLEGEQLGSTHIGWGDFIMNFAHDQSVFTHSAAATTYGVKFVSGTSSDVVNSSSLGLYSSVNALGVESAHSGWGTWGQYSSYVKGNGAQDPLLAGVPNTYFDDNSAVPNSIGGGNFVNDSAYQLLSQTDLNALGIDFSAGLASQSSQLGHYTFGFSFKRTAAMVGNFTAHLAMECANDVIAFPGALEATCH
jgi:choice-of-anchor A domain-containing protein